MLATAPTTSLTRNVHTDGRLRTIVAAVLAALAIAIVAVVLAVSRAGSTTDRPTHSTVQTVSACRPTLQIHAC